MLYYEEDLDLLGTDYLAITEIMQIVFFWQL